MRALRDQSRRVIAGLQLDYAEETGIKSLKIKYNNVLGYFIEVTQGNAGPMTDSPEAKAANDLYISTAEYAPPGAINDALPQLIANLQNTATEAVRAMDSGRRQADEGVERVLQADSALVGISDAVANITEMATQIAAAAEEQSAVAEEINRNISTIANLADQTSGEAQRTALLSEELTQTAQRQYSLVERFNR